VSYAGNLGLNGGQPQSVYQLDLSGMHRLPIAPRPLAIGQSMTLPGGRGKITFTGYRQWISLAITYDPGQLPALISACLALAGLILSFMVRRRRVFVRAAAGPDGSTVVDVGGLARSDAAGGFEVEFAELAQELRGAQDGSPRAISQASGAPGDPAVPEDPDGSSGPVPGSPEQPSRSSTGSVSSDDDQSLGIREGE
jgi:cytochrome c biogenesis protein